MTGKVTSQVQATEQGILRKFNGMPFCNKERSCGIRNALNVLQPLFRIEISLLRWFK